MNLFLILLNIFFVQIFCLKFLDRSNNVVDDNTFDPFIVKCFWIKGFTLFELWDLHTSPNEA
jgi:hypothetical protein